MRKQGCSMFFFSSVKFQQTIKEYHAVVFSQFLSSYHLLNHFCVYFCLCCVIYIYLGEDQPVVTKTETFLMRKRRVERPSITFFSGTTCFLFMNKLQITLQIWKTSVCLFLTSEEYLPPLD